MLIIIDKSTEACKHFRENSGNLSDSLLLRRPTFSIISENRRKNHGTNVDDIGRVAVDIVDHASDKN